MYWQEDDEKLKSFEAPDDVVDLVFDLRGARVPVNHAEPLAIALAEHLPVDVFDAIGVHPIRVAESGNGWNRPNAVCATIDLSRRTKLVLRANREYLPALRTLCGTTITLGTEAIAIGECKEKKLSILPTLFARSVICNAADDEIMFSNWVADQLGALHIPVKKMLCGMTNIIPTTDGELFTRSLLIADLSPQDSVKLQQQGLGDGRNRGCGLFTPHKSIGAVYSPQT